jgi:hypothetical protein
MVSRLPRMAVVSPPTADDPPVIVRFTVTLPRADRRSDRDGREGAKREGMGSGDGAAGGL